MYSKDSLEYVHKGALSDNCVWQCPAVFQRTWCKLYIPGRLLQVPNGPTWQEYALSSLLSFLSFSLAHVLRLSLQSALSKPCQLTKWYFLIWQEGGICQGPSQLKKPYGRDSLVFPDKVHSQEMSTWLDNTPTAFWMDESSILPVSRQSSSSSPFN